MAYTVNDHDNFSARTKEWNNILDQCYKEAGALNDIYVNEAGSGADPNFVTTPTATAAEHTEAINLMLRIRDTLGLDGQTVGFGTEDQTSRMTPFLQ